MILRYSPTGIGPYGGDYPDERPRTRGECMTQPRPCPWVSCRYHLAIDAHRDSKGNAVLRVLHEDPTEMADTCALDMADGYTTTGWEDGAGMDDDCEEPIERVAEAAGITKDVAVNTVRNVQRKMSKVLTQAREDYAIPESPRRPPTAETVLVDILTAGPRPRSKALALANAKGVRDTAIDWAAGKMRRVGHLVVARLGKTSVWSLPVGGKANPRHPGHAGKARGTD